MNRDRIEVFEGKQEEQRQQEERDNPLAVYSI